jgi:hypothetical protein
MRVRKMHSKVNLGREVAAIGDLSRDELVAHWTRIYGCLPPAGVRQQLLRYAVAWHLQAKRLGGLSLQTRKAVMAAAARLASRDTVYERDDGTSPRRDQERSGYRRRGKPGDRRQSAESAFNISGVPAYRAKPQTGARLIREWNGKTNIVDVLEGTFLFEGLEYASLSAIARKITGAHWSGPRFFGL